MRFLKAIRNKIRERNGVNLSVTIQQQEKPRIKAGFKNEDGFYFLYVNDKVAGYRMPEYVYFKGKKIFTK